jgi:hypothetical protein
MPGKRVSVNSLLGIVFAALVAYGLVVAAMVVMQPRLLFLPDMPSRVVDLDPGALGLAFEPVTIRTDDGVALDGWYVPAERPRGVVLFFHGNAGNIAHRLDSVKIFNDLNLDTLIFDYRGYGRSEGAASEAGLTRDAEAVWRYLTETRGVQPERIVLFGRSLGAAVAAGLAAGTESGAVPAGVIVESGFVSVPDLGARLYPWLPVRWLATLDFPTAEYLKSIASPVLVIHSRDDEIIPFVQGEALFEAAREPKRILVLQGGHNDGFLVSGRGYADGIDAFIAEALGE